MKGIESIIAIILILMIVIALSALAYTWFSGIFASLTGTASTAVTSTTNAMTTQFRIEAAKFSGSVATGTNVTIRNIGTQSFNGSSVAPYIGGQYSSYTGITSGTANILQGGSAVIYAIINQTPIICGTTTVMVTIGTGLTDSRTISC
jgi:FlaG/FlaF family flagellin (archaellin)